MKEKKNYSLRFIQWGLKVLHLNLGEDKVHLLVQIFNFAIVGVIATLIDFIFLYLFKEVCHFNVVVANSLSFAISVIYNYFASLTFVFDVDKSKSQGRNFVIFMACSIIGLGLNDLLVWVVTDICHVYYMISKVIATIFVMIFNFVTRKKFLE